MKDVYPREPARVSRRIGLLIMLLSSALLISTRSAASDKKFSIALKGSLTTGSQLFPNPNSSDVFQRAQFFSLKDIWGYGIEARYRFAETDLAIGLSADYLRIVESSSVRRSGFQIPVEDGYRVIPVELTGYFLIPISGEVVGVYMGGGAGAYFGRRVYRLAGTEAPTVDAGNGFGIHVLSGISWHIREFFSINAEMKFRDLQFNSTNRFTASQIRFGQTLVNVSTEPFESRVHTDGIIFQLGAMFGF